MSITRAAMVGGELNYDVPHSGVFVSGSKLSRTPSVAGDRRKFTYSTWIKLVDTSVLPFLLSHYESGANNNYFYLVAGEIRYKNEISNVSYLVSSDGLFRDVAEYYHLVLAVDTTQANDSDRVKIWVNNRSLSLTGTFPSLSQQQWINSNVLTTVGGRSDDYGDTEGYLSETYFIDGQALTPDYFAEAEPRTNQWNPKKYTGSFGSNGFYLNFEDSSDLGKDESGNGNDWVINGVTQSADTPTNNHAVLSAIDLNYSLTNSGGIERAGTRLSTSPGTPATQLRAFTFKAETNAKVYIEYEPLNKDRNTGLGVSVSFDSDIVQTSIGTTSTGDFWATRIKGNVTTRESVVVGSRGMLAIDVSAGKVWAGVDGVWYDDGDPSIGVNPLETDLAYANGLFVSAFIYKASADYGEADYFIPESEWSHNAPSGFKALSTKNLPEPKVAKPRQYFKPVVYTGNQTAGHKVTAGFQPDLVWIKDRTRTERHIITDSVNGAGTYLESNTTDPLATGEFDKVESIDADGFTVGASGPTNFMGDDFVAWCWKKGEVPGFDIVSYVGDGSDLPVGNLIPHGLTEIPSLMLIKSLDTGSTNWSVYHKDLSADTNILLNLANASGSGAYAYNGVAPSSTHFSVGQAAGGDQTNKLNDNYIAYLWAEIEGFSKFGSYTGNGSNDGPFVHCGFRPAYVMIKRTDASGSSWSIFDSTRNHNNQEFLELKSDADAAESPLGNWAYLDFVSNGFKIRSSNTQNTNGGEFIYIAFAEVAFKYSRAR